MLDQRAVTVGNRGRFADWEIDCIVSSKGDLTIMLSVIEHVRPYLCASIPSKTDAFSFAQRSC